MTNKSVQVFRSRYDNFFGKGTFDKLIEIRKKISKDVYIRVNLSKTSVSDVEDFLKKNRVRFSRTFIPNCLRIEKSFFNLSSSLPHLNSEIYFQDLASQVPVNLIDFNKLKSKGKRIRILDMAASPGSKTTQVLDFLNFYEIDYEVVALEPNKIRLNRLVNNIQKFGFEGTRIFNVDGRNFSSDEKFDVVLLDAPCSGNLIDDKSWLDKRDVLGIEKQAKLQKELLKNASRLVCDDGVLIYSTCSLEVEENEKNVDWVVKNLNLKVSKVDFKFPFEVSSFSFFKDKNLVGNDLRNSVRLMPYVSNTQGFFVCVFEKKRL